MPTPPPLSDEQRRAAYEKALELRRERAAMKRDIKTLGVGHFWACMNHAVEAQGMKVYDLLTALPGVGPKTAKTWLEKAGIPEKNTVRACGPKQTERLFGLLNR